MDEILEVSPDGRYSKTPVRLDTRRPKYVGYDLETGTQVVWASVNLLEFAQPQQRAILLRLRQLERLSHAHLVRYYTHWLDASGQLHYILDCQSTRTLCQHLARLPLVREALLEQWTEQLLEVVQYLHSQAVCLGSLSVDCVYFDPYCGKLKLGDLETVPDPREGPQEDWRVVRQMADELWALHVPRWLGRTEGRYACERRTYSETQEKSIALWTSTL